MNYDFDAAKTPGGAMLGERILIDGKPGLRYKAGKKEDDLTVEQLVECVSGKKVSEILYKQEDDLLSASGE